MASRRTFNWDSTLENIKNMEAPKKNYGDSEDKKNIYTPKLDDTGNSTSIIRFLPPHVDGSVPFVKLYKHAFKDINGWFIENCPSTIGENCPVCKHNSIMWNDGNEEEGRKRKRNLSYYANILVVKDPSQPELEGKVMKFRYGVKIQEKITEKLDPKDTSIDEKVIVFDYAKGANFKLKVKSVPNGRGGTYPNYDSSIFSEPSPIALGGKELTDEQINKIDESLFKLESIVEKSCFKSFDELSKLFTQKSGITVNDAAAPIKKKGKSSETPIDEEDEKPSSQKPKNEPVQESGSDESDEDFFARLANS